MKINVEDVFRCSKEMTGFNRPGLDEIEFYRDGKR